MSKSGTFRCDEALADPALLVWTDLEKVIEWQGPSWVFVGDRPQGPGEALRHYNLVMGISAAALSKDRRGNSTLRLHKNATLPMSQKKNRKFRTVSKYVDKLAESAPPGKLCGQRFTYTRAEKEPLVMLEMLVQQVLKDGAETAATTPSMGAQALPSQRKVHPLKMMSIFRDVLKSEEEIFRFDLFNLNERCVKLLRKVQAFCVEQSPLDYPMDEFGDDSKLNDCFSHMLAGVVGSERHQPTRFEEACVLVKEVVDLEGDFEYRNAKSRCFVEGDGNKKATDPFHTSPEDDILLRDRTMFGIIFGMDDAPGGGMTML